MKDIHMQFFVVKYTYGIFRAKNAVERIAVVIILQHIAMRGIAEKDAAIFRGIYLSWKENFVKHPTQSNARTCLTLSA